MSQNNDKPKHGAHSKPESITYVDKSSRMRKVLVIVVILLILLVAAIVFLGVQMFVISNDAATQQTQEVTTEEIDSSQNSKDAQTPSKKTTVPDLVGIIGMTQEEAIAALGHGAEITRTIDVNEEGNPTKRDVSLVLTEEPSDSQTGRPTVYLYLDEANVVIRAGYSVATSSIGYGSVSFSDAVMNEHIIESTLKEAGLTVPEGTAKLPDDKMKYSTYDSDGTTLVKEYNSFVGDGTANQEEYSWEAILSYDYSMANATDNLNDTIRTIYIYIAKE